MNHEQFFQNAAFRNMPMDKLSFLMEFMQQDKPASSKEMLPFLMGFVSKAKNRGIQFSSAETDFIIEHLKENMSPEERQKTDMIVQMMRMKKR
jgi:hypothetical protein